MTIYVKICAKAIKQHMDDGMIFDEAIALYPKLTAEQIAEIKEYLEIHG